jgi:hypothetical protein
MAAASWDWVPYMEKGWKVMEALRAEIAEIPFNATCVWFVVWPGLKQWA